MTAILLALSCRYFWGNEYLVYTLYTAIYALKKISKIVKLYSQGLKMVKGQAVVLPGVVP